MLLLASTQRKLSLTRNFYFYALEAQLLNIFLKKSRKSQGSDMVRDTLFKNRIFRRNEVPREFATHISEATAGTSTGI